MTERDDALKEIDESLEEVFGDIDLASVKKIMGINGECDCGDDCSCKEKEFRVISINKDEAALIFRQNDDGDFCPEVEYMYEDENEICSDEAHLMTILAMRVSDPEFVQEQIDWFESKVDKLIEDGILDPEGLVRNDDES